MALEVENKESRERPERLARNGYKLGRPLESQVTLQMAHAYHLEPRVGHTCDERENTESFDKANGLPWVLRNCTSKRSKISRISFHDFLDPAGKPTRFEWSNLDNIQPR